MWTLDGRLRTGTRQKWPLPPEEGLVGTAFEADDEQTPATAKMTGWRLDYAYQEGFWKVINGQDAAPSWYKRERAWCRHGHTPPNRRCRCGVHACRDLPDMELLTRGSEVSLRKEFGTDRPEWPCITVRRVELFGSVIPSLGKLAPGYRLVADDGFIDPPSTFRARRARLIGPVLIDCADVDTTRVLCRLFDCEVRQLPRPMSRVIRDHEGDDSEWWHEFPGYSVSDDTSGDMLI